jgi:hypothetical protein
MKKGKKMIKQHHDREQKRKVREDDHRLVERENLRRAFEMMSIRSKNPEYKKIDNDRIREEMAERREKDTSFREADNERRRTIIAERREEDAEYKKADQKRVKTELAEKRKDKDYRDEENRKKAEKRLEKKKITDAMKKTYKSKNNKTTIEFNKQMFTTLEQSRTKADKDYLKIAKKMTETLSVYCTCCEKLRFPSDAHELTYSSQQFEKFQTKCSEKISQNEYKENLGIAKDVSDCKYFLCHTCFDNNYKGKLTIYGRNQGIKVREIEPILREMTDLEERFVSKIIPFLQIREMKPYGTNTYDGNKFKKKIKI